MRVYFTRLKVRGYKAPIVAFSFIDNLRFAEVYIKIY